jgi:hypothetical protein
MMTIANLDVGVVFCSDIARLSYCGLEVISGGI